LTDQILNITSARYAAEIIAKFYNSVMNRQLSIHPNHINTNGSHVNLLDQSGQIFHVKFANENFHKFGEFFNDYSGEEGESIDRSIIDRLKDSDIIFFAQPEIIRKCLVEDIKRFGYVRENEADDNTETYSIALSRLEVFL
jgi:hypothetical protein